METIIEREADFQLVSTKKRPIHDVEISNLVEPPSSETTTFEIDDNVLAKRSDELWHKAKVHLVDETSASIIYLSSGETESIPSSLWAARIRTR
jgi:hypothetical protein